MKKILPERLGIIQKVILVLAVFAMSVVWPLGAFPVSHVSTCEWDGMRISGPSNENEYVRQEFSPNFEKLESISVYVANDPESIDTMQAVLRVYDYTGALLSENYFQAEEYVLPGYITVPVNLELSPGTLYFYTVGGVDGDLIVAYCGDDAKTAENGAFFYKEIPSGGTSIVTQYEYERPMGLKRIVFTDFVILFAAAVLLAGVGFARKIVFGKCAGQKAQKLWVRTEKIVRYSVVGVVILGVILSFAGIVIGRLFTDDVLNIVVLFLGVLIAAAYICYGVLTCKSELEPLAEGEADLTEKATRFVRALLLAVTVLMCCMYLNGYSNYEKGLYLRKILTFFGLFMVSLGKARWIWSLPNLVWSVAAFGWGKYYISIHNTHPEHITTATNEAWLMWVIGLLVIQVIYRIVKGAWKRLKDVSIPFVVLSVIFWVSCIIFSNGRQWPAVLLAEMLLWIFFYTTSGNRDKILEDICNGILLAFIGGVIFCLYRRPYQYYMLTRYGGIFYTATATATYYLLPAAAALTKILVAVKENNRSKLLFGGCLCGIVTAYMAFTASRTGIIAMAAMVLFAFFFPWKNVNKDFWKKRAKAFGVMAASVLLTFVMTFSATRMLPAMSGNPFYFWFEQPNAYFTSETPWKGGETLSETYIDIQKTLDMLFGRMFTVEDEGSSAMLEIKDIDLGQLYASAEPAVSLEVSENTSKYANGRLEIYQAYLSQLNLWGHETMSATDENGEPIMHAHNSYLQVAYDFGIVVGIIFLIVCLAAFLRAMGQAYSQGERNTNQYFPLLVIVGFGVASIFEWIYHIGNPLGLIFLVMFALIAVKNGRNSKALENG